ncbi:MAG: DUF4345 domain-containing protein [Aquabacterium sp.]|nr:MAG: DUF4345 domain-containing protein [Aquabacterium sp.]
MNLRPLFLWACALGIAPIALGYGLVPGRSMPLLFETLPCDRNVLHILRAVMGLYLALAGFWVVGALRVRWRQASLVTVLLLCAGLGGGRVLSLLVDGPPHWLLSAYLVIEIVVASVAAWMLGLPDES